MGAGRTETRLPGDILGMLGSECKVTGRLGRSGSGMLAPASQAGWSSWNQAGKLQFSACRHLNPLGLQR